ncbi:MAG: hypothetical protein E7119_01990 [Bacteroidales bacterium]|nr:hypothetical protein [Bacteroidales bacterium]
MKHINLIFFITLLLFGCAKEESQIQLPDIDPNIVYYANFGDVDTKTYVDANLKQYWENGDNISLFSSTFNQEYVFKGQSGSTSASFEPAAVMVDEQTALGANYAVYPYSSSNSFADGKLNITLPAVQKYVPNSFATGANSMVAVTSSIDDRKLSFRHICGYMRLNLYGNASVKSIELKGNNNEKIAGNAVVTAAYESVPSVEMSDDAVTAITVDCGASGVELGKTEDTQTTFWFVIPPVTFTDGFTITVTTSDGSEITKSTRQRYDVVRNQLNTMAALNISQIQPTDEIWYTTSDGNIVEMSSTDGFGASFVSNNYSNGKGVIKFDNAVTSVGNNAFKGCSNLRTVIIPEEVVSIGNDAFYMCTSLISMEYPEGKKSIRQYAIFKDGQESAVADMAVSNSASVGGHIGSGAFYGCSALSSVDISNGVTSIMGEAFSGCSSLTGIILPQQLATIGHRAFSGCSSLKSITIPEEVESIGEYAFTGCSNLTDVYYLPVTPPTSGMAVFDSNAENIEIHVPEASVADYKIADNWASYEESIIGDADKVPANQIWYTSVDGSVVVPSSSDVFGANILSNTYTDGKGVIVFDSMVTSIGFYAFKGCSNLASIEIPEGVTYIQAGAFDSCTNLSSVKISEGCEQIGMLAFNKCTSLSTVILPESITTLESAAFQNCSGLNSITIPSKVNIIDANLFNKCTNLTTVVIPEGVTAINSGAFNKCSNLASIKIPESVTTITEAFKECFNVKFSGKFASDDGRCLIANSVLVAYSPGSSTASGIEYTIPSGVKSIASYAFTKCTQISSLVIPEGVTSILSGAFQGCTNLKSVTIPSSVTQIKSNAFYNCTSLENVYCYPLNPPALESTSAFRNNAENRLIHVPKASESLYEGATVWSSFENYIAGDL